MKDGQIDHDKLRKTISTAMRMLDNVIDINYYAVEKARASNMRHRPVGLGLMGFQDALYQLRVPYASQQAVEFADRSMEAICYYAYWASTELARERGRYETYAGSLWDRGILPPDTVELLAQARGGYIEVDRSATLDWDALRKKIAQDGMRNSNCVAIAPTATKIPFPYATASSWLVVPETRSSHEPAAVVVKIAPPAPTATAVVVPAATPRRGGSPGCSWPVHATPSSLVTHAPEIGESSVTSPTARPLRWG